MNALQVQKRLFTMSRIEFFFTYNLLSNLSVSSVNLYVENYGYLPTLYHEHVRLANVRCLQNISRKTDIRKSLNLKSD
jgi:hypothetical protein